MAEEMLVNITPREVRIAFLANNVLQDVQIERGEQHGLLGNIYKGKVSRLLPGIQAAFIDIGLERSAFLHVSDIQGYHAEMDIRDVLQAGRELLVQIYKDPIGGKGARLTTQFTIPSRYLVLTPGLPVITASQKITDEVERNRLISLIEPNQKNGYIFRTAAVGACQEEINSDKKYLDDLWINLVERSARAKLGESLHEEIPMVLRVLRDNASDAIERIRVDHEKTAEMMRDFAKHTVPHLVDRIEYYAEPYPIFDIFSVEDELQKALQRKVYLKSGGHLIIDQTEAMTTIDVNTGSYLGTDNLEQTIFKTNVEAVSVIARQVRLRNLGGIIIIDFIDMHDAHHKEHILQLLTETLAKDPVKTQISELSSLGLVQMTRKRVHESLEHILCQPCPTCQQRGSIKSVETVCYEICRDLKRSRQFFAWDGFLVLAAAQVVEAFLEDQSTLLAELEVQLEKPIRLKSEPSFMQEQYNILPLHDELKREGG